MIYELNCPDCNNTGWVDVELNGRIVARKCRCYAMRQALRIAQNSPLGTRLVTATFKTFEPYCDFAKRLKDKAKSFCSKPSALWYIGGQVGSGKTHICCAIINKLLLQGCDSLDFYVWADLVSALKQNAMEADKSGRIFNRLRSAEILFIDDFFKGSYTTADIDKAFRIIDTRYNDWKGGQKNITLISGERTLNEIISIDEAIGSRLFEMAQGYYISIEKNRDKNYRLKNIKNNF